MNSQQSQETQASRQSLFLSVVAPLFNEQANLPELHARLSAVLRQITRNYEIIFVDDGSTDRSADVVAQLATQDPAVKLLSFSRNFGHQTAITAGLDYSSGDAVIVMDSDLQHPPELIPQLIEKWREGFDLVYTVRQDTTDATAFKKLSATLFYKILNFLSHTQIPPNAADFRLLDRQVVTAFANLRERTRFMRGLTGWVGFKTVGIPYVAQSRKGGQTSYSFRRMLRLAIDGIVSFSTLPLHVAIYVGFIEALLGFAYGLWVLYIKFFTKRPLEPGWTSVILVLTIMGGIQLMLVGILGLYLGKVYEEVKQRPLYLLRKTIGFQDAEKKPHAPNL